MQLPQQILVTFHNHDYVFLVVTIHTVKDHRHDCCMLILCNISEPFNRISIPYAGLHVTGYRPGPQKKILHVQMWMNSKKQQKQGLTACTIHIIPPRVPDGTNRTAGGFSLNE